MRIIKELIEIWLNEVCDRSFTAKKLFGWSDKTYDKEYWGRLERNWRHWKWGQVKGSLEIVKEEEEETEEENLGVREWTEDENKIGNRYLVS